MSELLINDTGYTTLLLGNEGLVRGALEAGVAFVSSYPGTPSSEVPDALWEVREEAGLYIEYAVNEKVAMEAAGGAAFAGLRSLTTVKHVGLNIAADPLMTFAYTGVRGALVIYNADDPGMHSSQNEQDNRYFAKISGLPMLEPANAQEMKDMTVFAFDLSEELQVPVIIRSTTRVAHSRGTVTYGELKKIQREGHFQKDPQSFVALPANTPAMHKRLIEKLKKVEEIANNSPFNSIVGNGKLGVISNGISRTYCADAIKELELEDKVSVLNLGITHPLPESLIIEFLDNKSKVLIVEELEPYLEEAVRGIAQKKGITIEIIGKGVGRLSRLMEYDPAMVREALSIYFLDSPLVSVNLDLSDIPALPPRPPSLCPGCPHRMTYYGVKQAAPKDTIFTNDIGCYTLGYFKPYQMVDTTICMGASVSMAAGINKAVKTPIIAFIGDSTFFHSGMPGLAHAVFNNHKFLLVIMDNSITAMTGHQPTPSMNSGLTDVSMTHIDLEKVVEGLGVKYVEVIKPKSIKKTKAAIEEALNFDGVSVIISREPCPLYMSKVKKQKRPVFTIDQEKCTLHKDCINDWACPAFFLDGESVRINPDLCVGCAVCMQVCPENAIKMKKE